MNVHIDLAQWQNTAAEIVQMPFPRGVTALDLTLTVLCGFLGFVTALTVLGKTQRLSNTGWVRTLAISLVAVVLFLAILVAVRLYALPSLPGQEIRDWAFMAAAVIAGGAIAVPVLGKLLHMNYIQSLVNTVLSVAVGVLAVMLAGALIAAARGEKVEFGKMRERKDEMNKFIGH
jgi:hypothetical protein